MQVLLEDDSWPRLPSMGNPMGKPNTHRPSPWARLPASVVAARANPALSGVMTKAKAAPKMTGSRDHQVAKEKSDAGEVTSQKSDEKKEDEHEKKGDKHEEKEDEHEKKEDEHEKKEDEHEEKEDEHEEKEDEHEEKTESNHQTTPVPEIAQAKEAPQALCLRVGMYQWPSTDNQTNAQCLP